MELSAQIWASVIHVRFKPIKLAERSKAGGGCQDFSKRTRSRIFVYKYLFSHFKAIFAYRFLVFWMNIVLKFFNFLILGMLQFLFFSKCILGSDS
jgi:hypothetical protein